MVGWFDSRVITATALDVVISTIFGKHADRRLLENLFIFQLLKFTLFLVEVGYQKNKVFGCLLIGQFNSYVDNEIRTSLT